MLALHRHGFSVGDKPVKKGFQVYVWTKHIKLSPIARVLHVCVHTAVHADKCQPVHTKPLELTEINSQYIWRTSDIVLYSYQNHAVTLPNIGSNLHPR